DGHRAEREPSGEQHLAGPVGGDGTDERGDADDDKRAGGRLRGGLPEAVSEHRNGQDRPAAAERAQAEADERAGDDDDREGHAASGTVTGRPAARALSNVSSIATGWRPAAARSDAAIEAR